MDRDIEEWMNIIVKLEDLFVLESFLHKGHYDNTAKDDVNQSLPKISIKGNGSFCIASISPENKLPSLKIKGDFFSYGQ